MKKIMLFFVACISCITVACDSDDDGTKGDDNKFPAPANDGLETAITNYNHLE